MAAILIVDDELDIRDLLEGEFSDLGHVITTAGTCKDALVMGNANLYDVVFLDIKLPDGNGLEILPMLREGPGNPEIIIMTAYGDPDGAELAVKNGAWDYLEKPVFIDKFALTLQRAIRFRAQSRLGDSLFVLDHAGVIGDSPGMRTCFEMVAKAATTEANVLITGETGTGKELFANLIHRNSHRAEQTLTVVDCASLPDNLVESMLFGHEKGAFTGADRSKSGLIQAAHQGTLFLDEVGELPLATQGKFLRVLQEHRYRPVGGVQEQAIDFRLVTATNRNLKEMLASGDFRRDLFYRLNTFTIELPPLRARSSDIKALAIYFANNLCQKFGIPEKGFSQDFFQTLETYNWPGNVRELANIMELVLTQAYDESIIFAKHLPIEIRAKSMKSRISKQTQSDPDPKEDQVASNDAIRFDVLPSFREYRDRKLEMVEREYLTMLVDKARGNHKKALKMANLARTRLYELLKKHGLSLK